MTYRSIVSPPRASVRRIEDNAIPRKETRGEKLSGNRFSRATPVQVRRIGEDKPDILAEELARNTYRHDGLGPYSELRGRLFA
jgi:hypothetical protein